VTATLAVRGRGRWICPAMCPVITSLPHPPPVHPPPELPMRQRPALLLPHPWRAPPVFPFLAPHPVPPPRLLLPVPLLPVPLLPVPLLPVLLLPVPLLPVPLLPVPLLPVPLLPVPLLPVPLLPVPLLPVPLLPVPLLPALAVLLAQPLGLARRGRGSRRVGRRM
jgi:hypothetical protein